MVKYRKAFYFNYFNVKGDPYAAKNQKTRYP